MLEGGDGPPIVLLQGEFAAVWMRVIPDLVTSHRVVAADLPGLGAPEVADGPPDAGVVVTWLHELIEQTCAIPPVLVGKGPGGALAARFTIEPRRPGRSTGAGGHARAGSVPAPAGHGALLRQRPVATDRARARTRLPALLLRRSRCGCAPRWASATTGWRPTPWTAFARPSVKAAMRSLMRRLASPIPPEDLDRIAVPTTLIWGRHDLGVRLAVAEAASARYGWPLHVIENARDDPAIEQPEAFLEALRAALDLTEADQGGSAMIPGRRMDGSERVETVIIGGGQAGLATGYHLARRGCRS